MAEEEQPTFGALLSRYRLAAGLTQQELANRAELSVRGISDLERGVKTRPRAYTVRHLAEALTLTVGDRDLFERSALHAAKRLQNVPMDEHTPAPHVAGRSVDASSVLRVPLLHGDRSRQQSLVRYIGAVVIVALAMGTVIFTLRPRPAVETVPFALLVASWSIAAPSPSKLDTPTAITIGDRGIVYVADSGADRIDAFSAGGRLLFSWGAPGRGPGQLRNPKGLAPDAFGHIYVADTGNNRIDKFSAHGRFLGSFGTRGTRSGQFRSPEGVAVGASSGWIYVADTGNSRVQAFTPSGVPIGDWDPTRSQSGKLLHPTSLVVTAEGRVLAADGRAGQVQVLESDGSFFMYAVSIPPPNFRNPTAVAQDAAGVGYVLDTGYDTVRKFDQIGHVLATWHGQFRSARGLAVDAQGNVYVADTGNQRIVKFAPRGTLSASWNGAAHERPRSASPRALAQGVGGNLYVADSQGNQIVMLSPSRRVLARLRGGASAGGLRQPSGVASGPHGEIYVADTGNNRIVKFARSGKVEAAWNQPGDYPWPFKRPHGLRVGAQGHVFVADTLNNRVEELSSTGAYLQVWYVAITPPKKGVQNFSSTYCSRAYRCGQWSGMAIDAHGFVYVTDTLHNLVLKLSPDGATVAKWGGTDSRPAQFRTPEGVAVSRSGTIYVADTGNHRVEVLTPSGKVVAMIRAGLSMPADLLLDETGKTASTLYVADSGTGLVEQFSIAH